MTNARERVDVTPAGDDTFHAKDTHGLSGPVDILKIMAITDPESALQAPELPMLARRDPPAWRQIVGLARESIFRMAFTKLLEQSTDAALRSFALDCAERAVSLIEVSDPELAVEPRASVEMGRRFIAGQALVSEIERVRTFNSEFYSNNFDALLDERPAVSAKILAFTLAEIVTKTAIPEYAQNDTTVPFDLPMCGEVWSVERLRQLLCLQRFMRDDLAPKLYMKVTA